MPKLSFLSTSAFDSGLAGLAALSAGFVAFAMPDPLFAGLVEASRLPDLVAAARPPLGDTARSAAAGAAALGSFVAVWGLMALLGRAPARREAEAEPEPALQVPRQRRADAHPDAPPRPPLLARDLGEPLELDEIAPGPAGFEKPSLEEADHRPLPGFLIPQEPETQAEPLAEAEPAGPEAPPTEASGPEPRTPVADAEPEPWTPAADAEPEREAVPLAELTARLTGGEPEEETDDRSLAQLVNRIEYGVSRKRQALPAADLPPAEAPAAAEPEKVGHRLRSAITDLQKIASSGA